MNDTNNTINYKDFPVLYVDDLQGNLESFKLSFEDDFTLFLTNNAKEAIKILEKENIALVISDQRMPDMTGVEFFKTIKDKYPDTIRMLITAYSDMDAVIDAINNGNVYAYIPKPIENKDLRSKIQQGINLYQLTKERDRLFKDKLIAMKSLAAANRLNSAIGMATGLSDRLNNYLVSVSLFFETFPKKLDEVGEQLNDEGRKVLNTFYKVSKSSMKKMLNLSREISNLCKPPKYTYKIYEIKEINNIIDSAVKILAPDLENRNITIQKETNGSPPAVYFDKNAIEQVLFHLIRNSIHAIPETIKGSIIVKVAGPIKKAGKDFIRISVKDNGSGISKENTEKVFNPFFTTKGTAGGFGLGLMTCQFIITQHDGEIEIVETGSGKGTTFIIDLPIKDTPPKAISDVNDTIASFPNRRR